MPNNNLFFNCRVWVYKVFVIFPEQRKIKKATSSYWKEFESAKKSGNIKETIVASIRLNQALAEYRQQHSDHLPSNKYKLFQKEANGSNLNSQPHSPEDDPTTFKAPFGAF